MSQWVNRTVLSGSSIDANGTASHTCTFTAATSGNMLVAVVAGAVTFTTPSGWTLGVVQVGDTGLYMFYKTASSGESSFSTTHNGSNYPIKGVVYEFAAGSSYIDGNNTAGMAYNATANGPQVTGLTGTYTRFAARSGAIASPSATSNCAWTLPGVEDYDDYVVAGSTDGVLLTIAYDDSQTGSSFNPSSNISTTFVVGSGEGIAFALTVVAPSSGIAAPWITA